MSVAVRAQLHLVGIDGDALRREIAAIDTDGVTVLLRSTECFQGDASPQVATVEATADHTDALAAIAAELSAVDRDRSMAIVAEEVVFVAPPEPTPVRYQYLMHRRDDFGHDQYLERYRTVHFQFGLDTPNLDGYVQLHVDLDRSAELGERTGLRATPCDSVSELHLRSVSHFIDGIIAEPDVGRLAQEDEERFVDRAASVGFCHDVLQG